jgi:hypothetical protein
MATIYRDTILSGSLSDMFYTKIITNMIRVLQNFFVRSEFDTFGDESVEFSIKKKLLISGIEKYYQKYNIKGSATLAKAYPISQEEIEIIYPNNHSKYTSFVVFGCPWSTDIDVACFVDSKYNVEGCPKPLFSSEIKRLEKELIEIGYDINRGIDYVILIVEKSRIIGMSKGGNMIGNVILRTYKYHNQKYEIPIIDFVEVDKMDLLRALSKFITDNLEYLVIDYNETLRKSKMDAYKIGSDGIIKFVLENDMAPLFNLSEITAKNPILWFDRMKSLVMKMIQFIIIENNESYYTKAELCECAENIREGFGQSAKWFLTRGKQGVYSPDLLPFLYSHFERYARKVITEHEKMMTPICVKYDINTLPNATKLPETLFRKFIISPYIPSFDFIEEWNRTYSSLSPSVATFDLNLIFEIECSNEEEQKEFLSRLKPEDKSKFIFIPQRSPEWHKLYRFYQCGLSSKEVEDTPLARHNLIRGCIGELMIMKLFDPSIINNLEGFKKFSLGFIVKEFEIPLSSIGSQIEVCGIQRVTLNSTNLYYRCDYKGCAPDLILQHETTGEIIPVEIKVLKSNSKNSDYYRAIHIATLQCHNVKDILQDDRITRCVVILSWFLEDMQIFEMNYFIFDI